MGKKEVRFQYFLLEKYEIVEKVKKSEPFMEIFDILQFIYKKDKKDRSFTLKTKRIAYLDSLILSEDQREVYGSFATALPDYRPPVVNIKSFDEKDNPRKEFEAEKNVVYFAIKIENNTHPEVTLIFHKNHTYGFSEANFCNYIKSFMDDYMKVTGMSLNKKIESSPLLGRNFIEAIDNMQRTTEIEILYKSENVHSNPFLKNIDAGDGNIESTTVVLKPHKKESLDKVARRAYQAKKNDKEIVKIVARGKDKDGHNVMVNTDENGLFKIDSVETTPKEGVPLYEDMINLLKLHCKTI